MSADIRDAIRPYLSQAEDELEHVQELGAQLHTLVVETAARVAANDGASRYLLHALDELTTAERAVWRAVKALTEQRAAELSFAAYGERLA